MSAIRAVVADRERRAPPAFLTAIGMVYEMADEVLGGPAEAPESGTLAKSGSSTPLSARSTAR